MSLKLIKAQHSDINDIMCIEEDAFKGTTVEKKEVFLERLDVFSSGFLLLKKDSNTIGYFCSELWNNSTLPYSESIFKLGHSAKELHCSTGSVLYIASMGILSDFRGGGNGSYLFNESLKEISVSIKSIKKHVLLVNETWTAARTIYKKTGFKEVQILEKFFDSIEKTPQNGIIMERFVNQ